MKLPHLAFVASAFRLAAAYLVSPPDGGTAAPGTTSDCSAWIQQSYSLSCADIESYYSITEDQFEEWNPITTELGDGCNLISDLYYCVAVDYNAVTTLGAYTATTTTTSTATAAASTTFTATTTVPSPLEPSTVADCTTYHLVVSGDTCYEIEQDYNISADEFNAWNPAVGSDCAALYLGDYVCVGAPYTSTTTSQTATTLSTSITAATATATATATYPTPLQPDSFQNCSAYHLVVAGDYCSLIEDDYSITADQFNEWNPSVGTGCAYLDLGYYVCVGEPIPSPLEDGTISTCTKFHLVESGDYCYLLEEDYGITADEFNEWNPNVGTDCASLYLGEYVCVYAPS